MMNPLRIRIPAFGAGPSTAAPTGDVGQLAGFLRAHRRVMTISGAGCSTASGIPAYRDRDGCWTHSRPISYQAFVQDPAMRRRYWARSYLGWPRIAEARPNSAHVALAELERRGGCSSLITQNVDGLHGRAGSRDLIELHGSLSHVVCLGCGRRQERDRMQDQLAMLNPQWEAVVTGINPDGDASLAEEAHAGFCVPDCVRCAAPIKPDVVFFGERVPASRVDAAWQVLASSDAVLVVGSSLVTYSAFRFLAEAARRKLPIAAVNQGRTRADALLAFKVEGPCDRVLPEALALLDRHGGHLPRR